jgi:hypothetical protein
MDAERLQGPARILLSPQLQLIMESGADKRRHNLPTSNEIAVIIPDEYGQAGFRDIVLANRDMDGDESFNIINPNNAAYMPLHYVLLFPNGDVGWHWGLSLRNDLQARKNLRLSQRPFYRYGIHCKQYALAESKQLTQITDIVCIPANQSFQLYFILNAYFNNIWLMHGLFAIKTSLIGYVSTNHNCVQTFTMDLQTRCYSKTSMQRRQDVV